MRLEILVTLLFAMDIIRIITSILIGVGVVIVMATILFLLFNPVLVAQALVKEITIIIKA